MTSLQIENRRQDGNEGERGTAKHIDIQECVNLTFIFRYYLCEFIFVNNKIIDTL